jgi:hypothetical protein
MRQAIASGECCGHQREVAGKRLFERRTWWRVKMTLTRYNINKYEEKNLWIESKFYKKWRPRSWR